MNKFGISLYPGIDLDLGKYESYIKKASRKNIQYVFMSLHLPEATPQIKEDFDFLLKQCLSYRMKVIIDTSKNYYDLYDWDSLGIYGLRLDFGFSNKEIVELTNKHSFKIYLNASTISEEFFLSLNKLGLNLKNVGVFHNFYPKLYSGLTREVYWERNKFYKKMGLEILGFVASHFESRLPLYNGLPTIEDHRYMNMQNQAAELLLMETNIICIGDSLASDQELDEIILASSEEFVFELNCLTELSSNEEKLLKINHKKRNDDSAYLIRSESSRFGPFANVEYEPNNSHQPIKWGMVTIDNKNYNRYKGELQIWLKPSNSDQNVNVIGQIKDVYRWILMHQHFIKYFKFKIIK